MAYVTTGVPEENDFAADSAYGGYRDYSARTGSLPSGYGEPSEAPNPYPDVDPFGVRSTAKAEAGESMATSATVTGLTLADGSWRDREELMKTDLGRDLVAAAEDIRKGHRRGFLDGLFSGSPLEYLPFTQMFGSVGTSRWMTHPLNPVRNAGVASSFYDKMTHGRESEVTEDERLAGTLDMYGRKLSDDGTWWYKVGSILKQAPAFFAEFGLLGKIGQVARAKKVAGVVGSATDASAERASTWALTRAAKIGFDEVSESAVRAGAEAVRKGTTKTFAQAVRELASSPEARKALVDGVAARGKDLVEGAANAAARNPAKWAEGLSEKVARVRAEKAVASALSRWSSDSVSVRMWRGLRKAVADSVAEGIMDLGSFGTEASTVISSLESSAGRAALRGVLDLTVGAAARGSLLYFPKEAVSQMVAAPLGAVNRNRLALEGAAFVNDDAELFDKAGRIGMFLDLLEYVSENTGRGFGGVGRAIGLKLAPGLMQPARRVAGMDHIVEATVGRDAPGKISKLEFSGLFDPDRYVEIGGRVNRFLTERFGGKAMREKVINDEMASVTRRLAKSNVSVANPAALQASLEARAFQPGVSDEVRAAIGSDIKGYVKAAVREANDEGLRELKLRGAKLFTLADWMTRHQLDPIRAAQYFERVGYDGVVSEMMEERYSDFMSSLFGLDARKDETLMQRLADGVKEAFYFDAESGEWKGSDMLAEAFAFAIPLVVRGSVMHGISRLGGPSRFEKDVLDWSSAYADVTRYSTAFQGPKMQYAERVAAQRKRLDDRAAEFDAKADEELAARKRPPERGVAPRVAAADEEVASWRAEAKRYRRASERAKSLFDNLVASLSPRTVGEETVSGAAVPDTEVISAPIYSDEYLLSSDEAYNLALHPTEGQMRQSLSAYTRLVNGAAEAFQTQFRMSSKRAGESPEGFRRIGHWVAETALRLTGFAATGDVSFMSANPARWASNDFGVPDDVIRGGEKMYGILFAEELKKATDGKIDRRIAGEDVEGRTTTSDYEAAHERALRRIRPFAEALMREMLVRHQTRMFSYDEVEDAAVKDVAADMGMEYDVDRKEFYSVNDPDARRMSYDEFVNDAGNKELVEETRRRYTEVLYDVLSAGAGVDRQLSVTMSDQVSQLESPVADVINIPRGLPTEKQVIYARTVERLAARLPQFRGVVTSQTVDPNRTIDDQTAGMAVRQSYLDHVRNAILPLGTSSISRTEDVDAALNRVESADPAVLERIAQDLRLPQVFTEEGVRRRNREIAMLALRSATVDDPNLALFARMATEEERDDRFGGPAAVLAPARRNSKGKWTVAVRKPGAQEAVPLSADSLDQLATLLKERFGYERAQPKVVYTATDVFTADTAFDMIRFLGLGGEYRTRMNEASGGSRDYLDPAARVDADGNYENDEEGSAFERARELRLAELHERFRKQDDPFLYMPAGTPRTDENRAKANVVREDAKRAWTRAFERTKDGRAVGYLAVAEDLLAQWGCHVRYSGVNSNAFGLASQSHRGKYSISIRAMHSSGIAQNVYVPISHVNAQDYSSALLEASLATRFSSNRAYIASKGSISLVRSFMDEASRTFGEVADSVRPDNPDLAKKIEILRDATVAHEEGRVRGMTPQTFATFVSAFNLFRTEVPKEWQRSVLGVHAEALVAVAPKVRKLTAYLGWTGVVDRMLGGSGLELEALKGDAADIGGGIARYFALYNPGTVGGGERRSLKDVVDAAYPDGFQAFADGVANQRQAAAAPRFPQAGGPRPEAKPQPAPQDAPPPPSPQQAPAKPAQEPPAEDPVAALRVLQADVVLNGRTPEEEMSVLGGGDAAEPAEPAAEPSGGADDGGAAADVSPDDVITDVGDFMMAPEPAQAPAVATSAGTREATAPSPKAGLLPSEARAVARAFQRMSTAMLGQQGTLVDLKTLVRDKLVPDITEEDWKALKDMWRTVRDDGKFAADWDFGVDKDEEGVMPDGYEGNNARAVEVLKSRAMNEFLALMDLVTPTSGRDFQPLVEDMRSNLAASRYLLDGTDAELSEALDFVSAIANPRATESADGACGRDAVWRHRMSLFDTEEGQRKVAKCVRALLGKEGEPPVNARAAVLLTYLTMVPTNVRLQLASLLGSCAPAIPTRLEFDRVGGRAVFLVREVPKRAGSMSFGVLSSSFARLAGKTPAEISAVADALETEFRKAFAEKTADGKPRMRRDMLVDASGRGVLGAYARVLAPVFGADSTLVTVLVSSNLRARLAASRNEKGTDEKSEWNTFLSKFAPYSDTALPDAAKTLVETLRGLAAVTKGTADRKTLIDRALDMFQSDSPDTRNLTGATTSLQGAGVWKKLLRAYSESKPTSIMRAEVNSERTSRPASSVAITMPGIEPALQQFMDRRSDDLGFEGVLRKWFNGYDKLSPETFAENVAKLRRTMQWPGVTPKAGRPQSVRSASQIVAKSISKTALASEVIAGCEAAYELEGAENPGALVSKYGERLVRDFVKRNMVYVPVYSGDHSSSIIVQVPLAAEFREYRDDKDHKDRGLTYDEAAELVSTWIGLDLLGADAKRSAVTSNEGAGTGMWDYAYDEKGNVLKDADGNEVRGHAYTGILWNSDPEADNEAMIGTTGILGYGADRQKEMAKDPKSGTVKCHIMAVGEDKVYGPLLSLIKSLSVSVDGSHGDFLEGDPKRFVNDFAKGFLDGLDGGAKRNSVTWSDFDSIKLGVANSKTIGVSDGAGKSVALMKHVFSKLRDALDGKVAGEDGKPVEIGTRLAGAELDKLVGEIEWKNFGGTGKKGRQLLSQLLDGAEIREVKRPGDHGGHRMFALMFRTDSNMAFTVANVSHAAKSEFTQTPRNYMLDSLAISRTLRTWNADDMNGRTDANRIYNGRDAVCDGLRDLVSGWSLTGAILSRDPKGVANLLAEDEEYQALVGGGLEHPEGNWARDRRMRVFAAHARKNNLNVPVLGTDYALVSNAGWVGKDGRGHSHSASQMFNDTLQGPRAIAEGDRDFLRGHRRAGLCNVNCIDASFRYGLFVDDGALEAEFAKEETVAPKLRGLSGFRRTVAILDEVISRIVEHEAGGDYEGPYRTAGQLASWRERLARCLADHHGNLFSERTHPVRIREKNRDGTPKIDPATGRQSERPGTVRLWETVSYADLFTGAVTDGRGRWQFDRTAVYENMTDSEGRLRAYLGGTMFGFPRTPSYNGSMVFQTLRAALPVTETFDEEKPSEWKPGRDAMVAPDPFTLKVLGCDHDGDKAKLYMLSPVRGRKGTMLDPKDLLGEADALIREIGALEKGFTKVSSAAQEMLDAHVRRLVDLGVVEYEKIPDGRDEAGNAKFREGGLVLTRRAKAQVSNAFVQGLFDASRMLPFRANGGESVVAGVVRNGGDNSGSAFGFVTADGGPKWNDGEGPAPNPTVAWDKVLEGKGVLGEEVFNVAKGKILRKPRVAARAQDSASRAGEARAVMVNVASTFHFGWMSGFPIGPFASRRDVSGKEWIDFMYHLDHLANMTFDDIKEQICLRLGVNPGMIETIVTDMMNDVGDDALLTTDEQFMNSFAKYAKSVNDPKSPRHWMSRAADPADYEFRTIATMADVADAGVSPGSGIPGADPQGDGPAATFVRAVQKWFSGLDPKADPARWSRGTALLSSLESRFYRGTFGKPDGDGLKDPVNGFAYWLVNVCPESQRSAALDDFAKWSGTYRSIEAMKAFANSVNATAVDPAANDASEKARRLDDEFDLDRFLAWAGDPEVADKPLPWDPRKTYRDMPGFGTVGMSNLAPVLRMRTAAALMYDRGVGEVVAAKGLRAHATYRQNLDSITSRYLLTEARNGSSTPGALVVHALNVVPRASEPLQLAANAQSVDVALAAFNDVPYVPKSPITTANAWDVLDQIGQKLASMRHPETLGTNVTLDVLYGIETMADVVARFVKNSYAGTQLGVFNYLQEVPNANRWWYGPDKYGGAAKGLSRLALGMGRTGGQIGELQELVRRVVVDGELDSDGALGSLPYASSAVQDGKIRSQRYVWRDPQGHEHYLYPEKPTFVLSVENLKKMKAAVVGNKGRGVKTMKANREQAESGTMRNLLEVEGTKVLGTRVENGVAKEAEQVPDNLPGALDELIAVFEDLEKTFGKGFAIEPSALFGQLIPLYSVISSRAEGVPDADSPSLLAMYPGLYSRWSSAVAKFNADSRLEPYVMANMAVNWSPRDASRRKGADDAWSFGGERLSPPKGTKAREAAEDAATSAEADLRKLAQEARELAEEAAALRRTGDRRAKAAAAEAAAAGKRYRNAANAALVYGDTYGELDVPGWQEYADPKSRHVLSVFDGARGVLFKNTLKVIRGAADEPVRVTQRVQKAAKPVAAQQPAQQPAAANPVVAKRTPAPDDAKPKDAYVQKVADRMAGIMKMWDMGRVEYKGGNTFAIYGRFHEAQGLPGGTEKVFSTRIDVEVLPEGGRILDDEGLRRVMNGPNYRQALAAKTGRTPAQLEDMAKTGALFDFAKANQPVGVSQTFRPGQPGVTGLSMSEPGEWRVDAERLGTLTGRIRLARSDKYENVVYHEFFHSVMGFMRTLGAFSQKDIAALQKRYGADNRLGDKWFNEEKAAEEFRALVNEGTKPDKSVGGIWNWVKDFLNELWSTLFEGAGRFDPDEYSNDMRRNPLAGIVLSGRFSKSKPDVTEPVDFDGKIDRAVETCLSTLRGHLNVFSFDPTVENNVGNFIFSRGEYPGYRLYGTLNDGGNGEREVSEVANDKDIRRSREFIMLAWYLGDFSDAKPVGGLDFGRRNVQHEEIAALFRAGGRRAVANYADFLNRVNAIGYPERSVRNAEVRKIVEDFNGRVSGLGDLFKRATIAFMKEYGPVSVPVPQIPALATVNVWAGSGENADLSNLSSRPFTHDGRLYDSVEHAYQTLKSGKFVQYVYDNFKSLGVSAIKRWTSQHKEARADRATNVALMNTLVRESFEQNPGAAQALLATGDAKITHEQATDLWKTEFPKALEAVREYLHKKPAEPPDSGVITPTVATKPASPEKVADSVTDEDGVIVATEDMSKVRLSSEQTQVVSRAEEFIRNVVTTGKDASGKDFLLIQGEAGTGKTTLVHELVRRLQNDPEVGGMAICVSALSRKAVHVLAGKLADLPGIGAHSLYSLSGVGERTPDERFAVDPNKEKFSQFRLVLVDEASMVSQTILDAIAGVKRRYPDICFVFLGDRGQVGPISTSGGMGGKSPVFSGADGRFEVHDLTHVFRQSGGSPILGYAKRFRKVSNGEADANVSSIAADAGGSVITDGGALVYQPGRDPAAWRKVEDAFRHAADAKDVKYAKVIAATNARVSEINRRIHDILFPDAPGRFAPGELVMMYETYSGGGKEALAENSEEGVVTDVRRGMTEYAGRHGKVEYSTLQVRFSRPEKDGGDATVPLDVLSPRDRTRWDDHCDDLRRAALEAKAAYGPRDTRTKSAWKAFFAASDRFASVKPGYAMTVHKAQGSTYRMVFVDEDNVLTAGAWTNEQRAEVMYTALTRAANVAVVMSDRRGESTDVRSYVELNDSIEEARSNPEKQAAEDAKAAAEDVSTAELAGTSETTPTAPNPKHESDISDLVSMPDDEVTDVDLSDYADDADAYMVAPAVASVRDAMRSVTRMNRPYTRLFSLARQVGLALRDGVENAPADTVDFLSSLKDVSDYAVGRDRAMAAVHKVASLYGVDVSDPQKAERLVFRAMNEIAGQLGSETWTKGFGKVRLADGTKRSSATHVSSAALAAAISTSLGVRPRDVAEAAIEDLNAYVRRVRPDGTVTGRYPEDNTFVLNVINPLVSALTRISAADPANLLMHTSEGLMDDVLKSMHAGVTEGGVNSDGTYRDFVVSKTEGASDNPYFESNRLRYMDHEGNPDFHSALHRALDAAYMIEAAMKFHRAIGFEPGTVDEMETARSLAPDAPEPLTGAEMAASMAVAPEQLTQDGFQPVYEYDQTWFCANSPQAWFDSVTRPGEFGGTDFRKMAQETHRQVAGFHTRCNATNVLMSRRFGLDVLPGQAIHAKVEGQTSDFVRDGGEIRYLGKGKGEAVEKYNAYDGVKAKGPDGRPLAPTLNQQRLIDMLLKARKVRYSGGSAIITGVDGVTFSLNDLHDADWYSWDKVQARARLGRGHGYSPMDTALVRMHRQLADDVRNLEFLDETLRTSDESWDDLIGSGDGKLNLYNRFVDAAVAALKEADRQVKSTDPETGRPLLLPNEVNDFVLGKLEDAGLVVTRERYSKGLGRHARTEGTVCIRAKEVEELFDRSSAKRLLLDAGRTEDELSYEGYAKPFDRIWGEVREFIGSSRFLSDGDGEFFHNVNTPMPFSQGSGFFMYYANRRAAGSKLQTDTETMNRWESAFDKLVNSTDLSLPVAVADAEQLLLFKELFHTDEKDVESIRAAMVAGDYSRPTESRPALSPALTDSATLGDLCRAIYQRMTGMVWRDLGDPTMKESAAAVGEKSIGRMVRMYERHRFDDRSLVAGGVGMTDELVYKMTGCLPHNDQLGHAVQRAVDGVTNAYMFRSTLYNMLTTPDEDGMPICYALPSEDAQDTGGIPDECWSSIASWWAHKNDLSSELDITRSGVWNARHIYSKIHGSARSSRVTGTIEVGGKPFAELAKTDIDQRSIEGFMAQATTPEQESKLDRLSGFHAGGYALGYAKHLLQSTRGTGATWQRNSIHRALAYSKGLSVSFGYFFPLTTRFESPIAATGLLSTLGGNFTPEKVREGAESLSKLQGLLTGKGWLTKDFTGQRDIFRMLDSNDPYLSELYHWAGALGLTISDANANPYEANRAIMEEDVSRVTQAVSAVWGHKTGGRVNKVLKAVLTSGGERAFTYHMNATKLAVASQLCTRMQIEAAREGKAFDPVRDLKKYSGYINSEVGGIDPLEYAWAHPAARNLMANLFFSWEWTRGSWTTGYNGVLEQILFGGHGVTREQRKFLPGRMARLFLTVGIGYPMAFQVLSKALGEMIVAGIDPDDPELDEKTRQLIRMVHETPWWTWQNEDKTNLTAWDVTPLAAAMGAAFPSTRDFLGEHPFLRMVPAIAAFVLHKPWLLAGSFPMYTGSGAGNTKTMARRIYANSGKQLWEDVRWWTDPKNQFFSKMPMPTQRIAESIMGRSLTWMDQAKPWADENDLLRWMNPSMDGALFNLVRSCVPFAATSTGNFGDAGFMTLVGPVKMGASGSDVVKRTATYLDRWASSDRRGYSFGGPVRSNRTQSYGEAMSRRSPAIASLVREAMANGFTEKDAYTLVSTAVGKLTGKLISDIVDEMPLSPGDGYDVRKMGRLMRKAQRLGRLPQDIYDSIKDRLVAQSRWGDVTEEAKRRMADIILSYRDRPYGTEPVRYDY